MSPVGDLKQAWGGFSFGQKVSIAGIFAVIFAGLISLPFLLKSANFSVLYSDLDESEAGKIVGKLKETNTPYKIGAGGKTILVPQEKVHELRLQMAMQGLPAGTVGFELFDKTNLGMTDFVQHLNYVRALQGELSRTICQLEAVEQARVHIVLPNESVFIENEKKPTASVVLKMRPSAIMGKKQINGIVHLVASSVEGLDPSNVTIVSSSGEVLFVGGDSNSPGMLTSSQFEMTQNVEKYFEGKIQGMMDGVLGPGKAIVRVSLDLNFDQIHTEKETFDPETVLRSEQTTKVESSGENGSNREETVSNYEVSKTVSKIVSEVGDIKRMTVALVVDGSYKASEEEEGAKTYTPRSEEELQKIEDLVKDCVNYNEERGDEVKIQNIPFDTSYKDDLKKELAESDKQMAARERKQLAFAVGDKALKVIVVVLVIFFAFRTLKNMRPKGAAQQGSTINMVSGGDAGMPGMPGGMGGAPGGMSAAGGQEQAFNPDSIVGPPPSFEPPPPVIQPPAASPENDQKAKEIADAIKKKWLSS